MKKFEYKVIPIPVSFSVSSKQDEQIARNFEKQLNQLGIQGWELVHRTDGFFFLKREIE